MKTRLAILASDCYLKAHAAAASGAPTLAGILWGCGNVICFASGITRSMTPAPFKGN